MAEVYDDENIDDGNITVLMADDNLLLSEGERALLDLQTDPERESPRC